MNSIPTGLVLIPGVVALLVLLVFSYLYEQSRQGYFRAWQLAWAAYTLHYALEALGHFRGPSAILFFLSSLLLVAMALCIFVSTRLMRSRFQLKWYDGAIGLTGAVLAFFNLRAHMINGAFSEKPAPLTYAPMEIGLALILLY
jgi:succinate-acetate transporter protein